MPLNSRTLRWRLKKEDCQDFEVGERDGFISTFVESDPRTSIIGRYFHWVADLNGRVIGVMSVFKVLKDAITARIRRYSRLSDQLLHAAGAPKPGNWE